ncbi:Pregnancy-associated glycoprotein 2 [Clonorchis sinensis]|uniref:Pregnancy-associated glycoprotein 2 n=1 Tax=Clonorchis sinensis TaxID=79923 RepID=A0A8T1M569_CLOSI|nr:Pregnancy-associated glycoprotein 2 [Clonorchis sinensis]
MIKNAYIPNDSETYVNTKREVTSPYGNYVATGHMAGDLVKLQSWQFLTYFSVVNKVQGHTDPLHLFDGIFGLSAVQFLQNFDSTSLYDMVTQGLISRHMFAFVFRRGGVDGKLIFGEFSEEDIPEEVKYVPLLDISVTGGHWMISTPMVFYENSLDWCTQLRTVVDTGTVKVYLPAPLVHTLLIRIWAQLRDNEYYVPCNAIPAMPMIVFQFENFRLTWEPQHYIFQLSPEVCQPRFMAVAPNSPYDMIFGMALLRNYATVFDLTGGKLGFTQLIG